MLLSAFGKWLAALRTSILSSKISSNVDLPGRTLYPCQYSWSGRMYQMNALCCAFAFSLTTVARQKELSLTQSLGLLANVFYLYKDLLNRIIMQFERIFHQEPKMLQRFGNKVKRCVCVFLCFAHKFHVSWFRSVFISDQCLFTAHTMLQLRKHFAKVSELVEVLPFRGW